MPIIGRAPVALLFVVLASCRTEPDPPPPRSATSAATAAPKPAASAPVEQTAKPSASEDLSPPTFQSPDAPSKPPTVAEWSSAAEVEVKNGKQLACEVKLVREWIRVSCRTPEDRLSQIRAMKLLEPATKPAEFFELVKPDTLASAAFPIRQATKVRIEFEWTEFKRVLSVVWTPGAPKPGVFFDSAAPKDLSKPSCISVCGLPFFPGRGNMECPSTHDPTNDEVNGCVCRAYAKKECAVDW